MPLQRRSLEVRDARVLDLCALLLTLTACGASSRDAAREPVDGATSSDAGVDASLDGHVVRLRDGVPSRSNPSATLHDGALYVAFEQSPSGIGIARRDESGAVEVVATFHREEEFATNPALHSTGLGLVVLWGSASEDGLEWMWSLVLDGAALDPVPIMSGASGCHAAIRGDGLTVACIEAVPTDANPAAARVVTIECPVAGASCSEPVERAACALGAGGPWVSIPPGRPNQTELFYRCSDAPSSNSVWRLTLEEGAVVASHVLLTDDEPDQRTTFRDLTVAQHDDGFMLTRSSRAYSFDAEGVELSSQPLGYGAEEAVGVYAARISGRWDIEPTSDGWLLAGAQYQPVGERSRSSALTCRADSALTTLQCLEQPGIDLRHYDKALSLVSTESGATLIHAAGGWPSQDVSLGYARLEPDAQLTNPQGLLSPVADSTAHCATCDEGGCSVLLADPLQTTESQLQWWRLRQNEDAPVPIGSALGILPSSVACGRDAAVVHERLGSDSMQCTLSHLDANTGRTWQVDNPGCGRPYFADSDGAWLYDVADGVLSVAQATASGVQPAQALGPAPWRVHACGSELWSEMQDDALRTQALWRWRPGWNAFEPAFEQALGEDLRTVVHCDRAALYYFVVSAQGSFALKQMLALDETDPVRLEPAAADLGQWPVTVVGNFSSDHVRVVNGEVLLVSSSDAQLCVTQLFGSSSRCLPIPEASRPPRAPGLVITEPRLSAFWSDQDAAVWFGTSGIEP